MTHDRRTDRELVDAVISGDHTAFRVLVDRESPGILATCGRILRDPVEAEDAAQDAFLQAYRAIAAYRGDGPFGGWLRRIAIRIALGRLAERRDLQPITPIESDQDWGRRDGVAEPEAQPLDLEWQVDLGAAIARLPASQRDVVLLRFFRDLSLDEIAEITSQPVGTVKSRLHRAIVQLRTAVTPRVMP